MQTEMRTRSIALSLSTPAIQFNIHYPAGDMTLADLARAALAVSDASAAIGANKFAKHGEFVACRIGCAACCRQLVSVSPAEAWMLDEHWASLPEPRRGEIADRFTVLHRKLESAGMVDVLFNSCNPDLSERDHFELARNYHRLGMACPFLESELCSVYAMRPAACREYLVSSHPTQCADPFGGSIRSIPIAAQIGQALAGVCARVLKTEVQLIPLALGPWWAQQHRRDQARRFESERLVDYLATQMEIVIGQNAETRAIQ